MTRDEREARQQYREVYARPTGPAAAAVERAVLGGDWGAHGYLTRDQADELSDRLELRPGVRLLDAGTGRGWPGLYLAASTGCDVVLSDLPAEGLRTARDRAVAEGIAGRVSAVAASAAQLPLRPGSVDAVVQSDVLC